MEALANEGQISTEKPRMMTGWKTLLFNAGIAVVGVLQAFDWTTILGNVPQVGWIVAVIGAINMVLRSMTSTPVMTGK